MWPLRRAYQISPKKYLLQVSVLLGFLTTIPLARSQNHGTLRGIISSRFGVMSDVLVSLYSTDRVLQIKSDSNGRFEFADAPSGTYELEASIAGFQTQKVDSVRIPEKGVETIAINLLIANQPSDCGRGLSAAYEKAASGKPALIGIVRGYPGGPLAGFKIRLWKEHGTKALASQRSTEKVNLSSEISNPAGTL